MFTDDEGRLWVRLVLPAGERGKAFGVFEANGRYVERTVTPLALALYPMVQRGMMFADARAEDDVPFTVGVRISR